MDSARFDALTRVFVRPASRRKTLACVVAAALTPLTTAAQPEPAKCLANGNRCSQPESAGLAESTGKSKRKGKGKHRRPACTKCCSGYGVADPDGKVRCTCKGEGIACDNSSQCCGVQCRSGFCTACPGSTVLCADGCADLQTNAQHCGSCDHACSANQRCQNGSCVCDTTICPNGCDVNHQCCPAGSQSVNGGCFTICNTTACGGGCVCAGSVDGSGNRLCYSQTVGVCDSTAECPAGQACQVAFRRCLTPC